MSYKRIDGRAFDELRKVRITPNVLPYAEGSVLIEMGKTKVICTATLEEKVPPFLRGAGTGWVTAEYAMLPRATQTRTQREIQRLSGRTQEIQRLIGRSLRAAVDFTKLGERQIIIDCDVIMADGGTRCASITGGFVALAIASQKLVKSGTIKENPVISEIAAVSVGIIQGNPVLDLCYEEDSSAEVDMNVVCTGNGNFVEIQGTAELHPFDSEQMSKMIELAKKGISELVELQKRVLEKIQ